jgi:hypothetical protein
MSSIVSDPPLPLEPVRTWRLEQLEAAGYPAYDAHVLSERADVDLHVAVGLLQAGCPVDTALRILL